MDIAVVIGRFQPLHLAHEHILATALARASRVVVMVGSSFQPPTPVNPWSFEDRRAMILASLSLSDQKRISVLPSLDHPYWAGQWAQEIRESVNRQAAIWTSEGLMPSSPVVQLVGHEKDSSAAYLRWFPEWGPMLDSGSALVLGAEDLRRDYFDSRRGLGSLRGRVSEGVWSWLAAHPYDQCWHADLLPCGPQPLVALAGPSILMRCVDGLYRLPNTQEVLNAHSHAPLALRATAVTAGYARRGALPTVDVALTEFPSPYVTPSGHVWMSRDMLHGRKRVCFAPDDLHVLEAALVNL